MKTYNYFPVLLLSLVLLTACTSGLNQNTDSTEKINMVDSDVQPAINDENPPEIELNEPEINSMDTESSNEDFVPAELPPEGENDFEETSPKPVGELEVESKVPQSESNDEI